MGEAALSGTYADESEIQEVNPLQLQSFTEKGYMGQRIKAYVNTISLIAIFEFHILNPEL